VEEAAMTAEFDDERADFESATGLTSEEAPEVPVLPEFGLEWNEQHGWIVWARNDQPYWVTTTLHWWAGEDRTWKLNLPPCFIKWRASDGDGDAKGMQIPQNLRQGEEGRAMARTVELSRPEADALVQAMSRLPDAPFERARIEEILKRADVPEGAVDRIRPSHYDRWLARQEEAATTGL
jgi:hypothetical protein